MNLLLNPNFEFHTFENHRAGNPTSYMSHAVAFWNTEAWGDITVTRESHVDSGVQPAFSTGNMVSLKPGKKLWQFIPLPEAGLAHGESLSLSVYGHQGVSNALRARIRLLKTDSEDGVWKPSDFGINDKREFPRQGRGELVTARLHEASVAQTGAVALVLENIVIEGHFHRDSESSHSADMNTIGIQVEFENTGPLSGPAAWVYAPCLSRGSNALARLPEARPMIPYYRYIPRTIQKLWKGEALHVVAMGSSIDVGGSFPPLWLYDENPASPAFKTPISGSWEPPHYGSAFEPDKIGRSDLAGYFGWWQHYFTYTGRLRLELMRKFNLPISNLCFNIMARSGSSLGEAHSGLEAYATLAIPPGEDANGHRTGKTWRELYPDLFSRPEGPRPDLVIFGGGHNMLADTPDEVAVIEGAIRWFQRRYPGVEFIFCMFQNNGGYTPCSGDLQALAVRYQIPMLDIGKALDDITRWCNAYTLVPADGHPNAAVQYLWFKQIEKAFECWDPILPGQAQLALPERLHRNTYGWEGEITTFAEGNGRLRGGKFVFEDIAINCWAATDGGAPATVYVDGEKKNGGKPIAQRNVRRSFFHYGNCSLGDRHILEVAGTNARLMAVDAKLCPNRRFFGVDSPAWNLSGASIQPLRSEWGAPYGDRQVVVEPGKQVVVDVVATDISVAYADVPDGGALRLLVDGAEKLLQPADKPFKDAEGKTWYMENRRGVRGIGFGLHRIVIEAVGKPVHVLGLFAYDSRSNRNAERRLLGSATAGEVVRFSAPFAVRPVVICHGNLQVKTEDVTPESAKFSGGAGLYEVVGE